MPRAFATERAAWEAPHPAIAGAVLHVEAAAHRGQAVAFRVAGPGDPIVPATVSPTAPARAWRVAASVTATTVILATLLLARRNLRAGRGDRRGAWRLFCLAMTAMAAAWIVSAKHYASLQIENERLFEFVAHAVTNAGTTWILYIALEPWVRRYTPSVLISWTRVFSGQILDSRVGRDLLIGVGVGTFVALVNVSFNLIPVLFNGVPGQPRATNLQLLLGAPSAIGFILRLIPNNLQNGLFFAVGFGVGRAVTGRVWGGTLLAAGLLTFFILGESSSDMPWIRLGFILLFVGPMVASLYYGGLLSLTVAFFVNQILNNAPLTLQPSMPYAPAALAAMLIVFGLAAIRFLRITRRTAALRTTPPVGVTRPRSGRHIIRLNGVQHPLVSVLRRGHRPARGGRRAAPSAALPCRSPQIDTVMPADLPGMDDATRLAPGAGAAPASGATPQAERRSLARLERLAPHVVLRLALVVGRHRSRPLRAGHAPRRTLSHRRAPGPRRHGRGLSRRRPEARPAGRAQVPAARRRQGSGAPDPAPHRSPDGAAGLAPERLPRLRHRRSRGHDVPLDGVRGRRGSLVAAQAHRPLPRGPRRSRSRGRSAPASPRRTSATSSTAISSPPT